MPEKFDSTFISRLEELLTKDAMQCLIESYQLYNNLLETTSEKAEPERYLLYLKRRNDMQALVIHLDTLLSLGR